MKAAIRTQYGPPQIISIQETTIPIPKSNEILIKVHYTTVNRTDCAVLTGKPAIMQLFTGLVRPNNPTTGTDFAGEIIEIGSNVTRFKKGNRIWGFNDEGIGTHQQFITLKETENIAIIPDSCSFEKAAASAEAAHYAYNFIKSFTFKSTDKVLVYGASGGIGSALIQFLVHFGVYTTAVCNTKNVERIRALGPNKVIDYQTQDFTLDPEQYTYFFDAVGKVSFNKSKKLLSQNGIYISSELGKNAENIFFALFTPLFSTRKVIFPLPKNIPESLSFINDLLSKQAFNPLIDRIYELDNIADAYTYVMSEQKTGNVLLKLWH